MRKPPAALLCAGAIFLSQIFSLTGVNAQSTPPPVTPSQIIDASNYSATGDLQISSGQNVVVDFSNAPGGLQIGGNLINNGNLFAISTGGQTTANFFATNITNSQSGLFTSVLPQAGIAGFSNAISGLSLALSASNNIINQGIISSAGDLNLAAGNALINALPANVIGPAPLIQAFSNVIIVSSLVQNTGLISSISSNINVASQIAQNLTINNQNGTFSALNFINVREALFTPKFDTTLLGGDWLSSELNIFSGEGAINVDVNSILGQATLVGGAANIETHAGDLHVAMKLTGDPFIGSAGNGF